jgi:hypothetical protein
MYFSFLHLFDCEEDARAAATNLVDMHAAGDFGALADDDRLSNLQALHDGSRIISTYYVGRANTKVYVITEADRSSTTVLPAKDY